MKLPPDQERAILANPANTVGPSVSIPGEEPQGPAGKLCKPVVAITESNRLVALVPVATTSEVNGRDWRKRSRRTDSAWSAVSKTFGPYLGALALFAHHYHQGNPLRVRFTRLGGRRLDASNLPTATKATEDAVAFILGASDGDPRWRAEWDQQPGGSVGVRIEMECVS